MDNRFIKHDVTNVMNDNFKVVAQNEIDFSVYNADISVNATTGVLLIPKNAIIDSFHANVLTAQGAAATAKVGLYKVSDDTAVDDDYFTASLNLNAPGVTAMVCINKAAVATEDLYIALEPTIDLTLAKVKIMVSYMMSNTDIA